MSFVTTARLYFGHSRRLNRSTSAVFPEPTGPAIPTRNARIDVDFSSRIPDHLKTGRHPPASLTRRSLPACRKNNPQSPQPLRATFSFRQIDFSVCSPLTLSVVQVYLS